MNPPIEGEGGRPEDQEPERPRTPEEVQRGARELRNELNTLDSEAKAGLQRALEILADKYGIDHQSINVENVLNSLANSLANEEVKQKLKQDYPGLSDEQASRIASQVLAEQELQLRARQAREQREGQQIRYPSAEPPPARESDYNAERQRNDLAENEIRRLLAQRDRLVPEEVKKDPNAYEELSIFNPQYGEVPVWVLKDKEALMEWMKEKLYYAESFIESFGAEVNAGELQQIALVMRALRESGRRGNQDHAEKAEQMREEYDAGAYYHEYFVRFRGPEDPDRMFDNGQIIRSKYLKLILSDPRVLTGFLLYKNFAERYFKASGEYRTKPEEKGIKIESKEDVRHDFRLTIAREYLPQDLSQKIFKRDFNSLNPEEQARINEAAAGELRRLEENDGELYKKYGWAQNRAERAWRISKMSAMQNWSMTTGKRIDGSANNGDLLMERTGINYFFDGKETYNFWPQLFRGIDVGEKDMFSFFLGEVLKAERRHITVQIKKEFPNVDEKEVARVTEEKLKEKFRDDFDVNLTELTEKGEYRLKTTNEVTFDNEKGQDTAALINEMTDKTIKALVNYNWDAFSDTAFRGWLFFNVINIDKVRVKQITAGSDLSAFLRNPNAATWAAFVADLPYRGGEQRKIRIQGLANLWKYMTKERRAHKGIYNAYWDEAQTMLDQAVGSGIITYSEAEQAKMKAVRNELLIKYKKFLYYFDIWAFLLSLLLEIGKEGVKVQS